MHESGWSKRFQCVRNAVHSLFFQKVAHVCLNPRYGYDDSRARL
jgi:hypothetical protein